MSDYGPIHLETHEDSGRTRCGRYLDEGDYATHEWTHFARSPEGRCRGCWEATRTGRETYEDEMEARR